MIALHLQFDQASLREAQRILKSIPGAMPRVMRRTINRTVDMAATDLKRRVTAEINIKSGAVSKSMKKSMASLSNWTGHISATLYRPGLKDFKNTRWSRRRGLTYRISNNTGSVNLPHGFMATMTSGHHGAFQRSRHHSRTRGQIRMMRKKPKEAIFAIKGPSIWEILKTPGLLETAGDLAATRMAKHLDDQIKVELDRWQSR